MTKSIIITAGGKGLRMGSEIPKQFLTIGEQPILMATITQFYRFDPSMTIVIVLPKTHLEYWDSLVEKHQFEIDHQVVKGGETRFHSIQNGLEVVHSDLVGVHDGVRPFVSRKVIENTFKVAATSGAAIPVISLKDSIRKVSGLNSQAVNREDYQLVQTPQCFKTTIIKAAYANGYQASFTDDASVVEAAGHSIQLVEGNDENVKITTPNDLKMANWFLNQ
ncbi:2-C-methyl-D-erythritol 4-phosphate cytidylyltransferase [Putridiphycobacter roseus]|uniref:2-C-methyl-D-erythritol 4-phosphate cytidylyltransferase n=1 Tax=Putridiphycobacter roseus TaxID=2219161 RepID=A0A2W1MXN9_9FLAO|nr:2-C-methyl-D-erythritol 4-phosphate cytidylyltransferase [Putridiphycobacter roseus]PZE16144.1 2-C-methyl-D-erythritol 4-phosphate cytidylyltransferase [Putridiphycobacter roseus]